MSRRTRFGMLIERAIRVRADVDGLRDASRKMGFSETYLEGVMAGRYLPSYQRLDKIISFLGLGRDEALALVGLRPRISAEAAEVIEDVVSIMRDMSWEDQRMILDYAKAKQTVRQAAPAAPSTDFDEEPLRGKIEAPGVSASAC